LVPPAEVGAELVRADRGGDVTYHGPGQLVGYPIVWAPGRHGGGMADTVAYVTSVEQLVIDALADVGLPGAARLAGYPGVWVGADGPRPRKIAAVGVKLTRGRSMHGFALNVDPDLGYFDHIVPCGIVGKGVTSLAAEGVAASMHDVVDAVAARAVALWGAGGSERADVVWRHRPEDLSAFTRGEGPGAVVRPVAPERAARRGRGRGDRRIAHRGPQARVDAGQVHHRTRVPPARVARRRPRAGHGVPGGGLPQHLRVLERRHGHVHGQR
jgi:lipoic acid synthetase